MKACIMLTAQHIPGMSNCVADAKPRIMRDCTDWKLNPTIFNKINKIFGPLEVDLFASRLTHQLPCYFSWRPDPMAEATDAFQQNWGALKGFANPPWCFIGRILSQVMEQKAQVVMIAPIWKGQPWYPVILGMLWEVPRRIPHLPGLIQNPVRLDLPELTTQLAVWPISGRNSVTAAFRRRLQDYCWPPGGPSQTSPMTRTSESGLAGVQNEVLIPF